MERLIWLWMYWDGGLTVFGLFANPRAAQAAYEDLRFGKASELAKQVYLTNFFNVKRNGQDRV